MAKENTFRTRFNKMLKSKYGSDLYMQKHHGSEYSSGLPDMLYLWQGQHYSGILFLELKSLSLPVRSGSDALRFKDDPTALQLNTMLEIDKARPKSSAMLVHYEGTDFLFIASARAIKICRDLNMVLSAEYIKERSEGVVSYKEMSASLAPLSVLMMGMQSFDFKMGV